VVLGCEPVKSCGELDISGGLALPRHGLLALELGEGIRALLLRSCLLQPLVALVVAGEARLDLLRIAEIQRVKHVVAAHAPHTVLE